MALPDDQADGVMQGADEEVARLAQGALEEVLREISRGRDARDAVAAALSAFAGQYEAALAESFSKLLTRAIGVADVRVMPVGAVKLSDRLYAHAQQTSDEVAGLVREHAQGLHNARELALKLYDGYDPKNAAERPLEGRARAELPKALQALTRDPETRKSLEDVIRRGQAQAARLKSPALRAGYAEAFDAWAKGAGEAAIKRKLDVALKEKTRYMANRIARTELARAHQAQVAEELMADDGVEVVQVLMNPAHPLKDICDLHASANLFGLGAGCYPKAKAPQPPFHPHCLCKLRARRSLSGLVAQEVEGGAAAWLRGLPVDEAARVMGSRERLQQVLDGASVDEVVNSGKDLLYRLRRLGDASGHVLASSDGKGAFNSSAIPRFAALQKNDGDAQAYVLGNGRRTGHEYLYAFDEVDGRVLARHTSGMVNGVSMPQMLMPAVGDKRRKIVVYHNHPSSLPPSPADLAAVAELPGISRAVVLGHDGSRYQITPMQRGNISKAIAAAALVLRPALQDAQYARMPREDRDFVVMAARLDALRRAGVVGLSWNIAPEALGLQRQLDLLSDVLCAAIEREIGR